MPIEEVTRKEKHFNRLFPGEKIIIKRLFTLKKKINFLFDPFTPPSSMNWTFSGKVQIIDTKINPMFKSHHNSSE